MTFSLDLKNNLKSQYEYSDNLVDDFYNSVLNQADLYQRISGYFTSSGVDLYAEGLEELAKNGGEVQFIISKEITASDYEDILSGYKLKEELKNLKLSERNEKLSTYVQQQLGNLAFMIANGRARVKVALMNEGKFHEKMGLISSEDEIIYFIGSANETKNGFIKNYESISVDVSWDQSENVKDRINESKKRFHRLWTNTEPGVTVIEASELTYEELALYQAQATITKFQKKYDDVNEQLIDESINFRLLDNRIVRIDNTKEKFTNTDRHLKPGKDLSKFFEQDNSTVLEGISYKDLQRIIDVTKKRAQRENILVTVSDAVEEYITRNQYSIEQYKILGGTLKNELEKLPEHKRRLFESFSKIVQEEVSRPLRDIHLHAAYYEYEMMRTANFSVPGAGKTAMILGVFAYLNRKNTLESEKIDRILVVCPINAFDSWKKEFEAVFGDKKALKVIDSQNKSFKEQLKTDWGVSNLVLVNYEALSGLLDQLMNIVDHNTLLVFDEVHRIKNPYGQRAESALKLARIPKFKYVLTGTPIPNKYSDIYNFLHILYSNEYGSFFGWDLSELDDPKVRRIEEINETLYPFFWRTNKKDLKVHKPEEDKVYTVPPSEEQLKLAEAIYKNEQSSFAKLIRLIQASTNPELLNFAISYDELMSFDDDDTKSERITGISQSEFNELLGDIREEKNNNLYNNLNANSIVAPKFTMGISLVKDLVDDGKKVLVWGIFVNTIQKIQKALEAEGISVNLVYGGTPTEDRVDLIDQFRNGDIQVLISNPQTLGESISLHQTVHDAVYFEYDFNLTYMLQSRDRIHRLGLPDNQYTRYYYLQTKGEDNTSTRPGFIDDKIYKRIKEKEETMYNAVEDNTLNIEYSENEILDAIKIIDEERKRIS